MRWHLPHMRRSRMIGLCVASRIAAEYPGRSPPMHEHPTTQRTVFSPGPLSPQPSSACLVVIHGEGLGKRQDVRDETVRIGRAPDCTLLIAHPSISRRHCEVWREEGRYWVRDLGATNRTRVNDRPVERVELKDGDHLTVGETLLKFISHESLEARYHEEVYQLATQDGLTELANRRHFAAQIDIEIVRSLRHARDMSLCLIDIDHFKPINDRFGHIAGDLVLKQMATVIRGNLRREDLAARIGGEEFAIVLPETAAENATVFANTLREAIAAEPFHLGGEVHHLTVSIGIAGLGPHASDRSSLMRNADKALYHAKESGRNRVCLCTSDKCVCKETPLR